jgi:deoxyadenosine/deoxycytidine kinase
MPIFRPMRYRYITVEGNIGAGKTSLATILSKEYSGKLILEQFADNPFLPHFYRNPRQYAFPLELFFLAERFQQLKDVAQSPDLFNHYVVSDYLFAKSHLFASINLNEEEMKLFKRLALIMQTSLPDPELLFYLHTPVPKLMENIAKRGRSYEKDITPEYLKEIQDGYFELFRTLPNLRIVVLDMSNIDFVNREKDYRAVLQLLEEEHDFGMKVINRLAT